MSINVRLAVGLPRFWFKASSARKHRNVRIAVMKWRDAYRRPIWSRRKTSLPVKPAADAKSAVKNHPAHQVKAAGENKLPME
jgi:hypothetical protein